MLYQLSYFRGAAQSSPRRAARRRADRGPLISRLGAVSARTFAVFMGVLAVIGLLAYGVISKGHGTLAEGDDVPTTALPKLDDSAPARSPTTAASGCWSTSGPAGACPAATRRRRSSRSTATTAASDFEVLGIDTQETDDGGRGFVHEFGLTYPQLHDGEGTYADDLQDDRRAGELPRRPRRHPRRSPSAARSTPSSCAAGRADDRGELMAARRLRRAPGAGRGAAPLPALRRPRSRPSPRPRSPTSRTR